jgi:hypothetical protein
MFVAAVIGAKLAYRPMINPNPYHRQILRQG